MNKILSLGKQIQFDGTLHRQARKDKNIAHFLFEFDILFWQGWPCSYKVSSAPDFAFHPPGVEEEHSTLKVTQAQQRL